MWLVNTILDSTNSRIVSTSQKALLINNNPRGSLQRRLRTEIFCGRLIEEYLFHHPHSPSFGNGNVETGDLELKQVCCDHQVRSLKENSKIIGVNGRTKAITWVTEIMVELAIEAVDLFLLVMNILWFNALLLWFSNSQNSVWYMERSTDVDSHSLNFGHFYIPNIQHNSSYIIRYIYMY